MNASARREPDAVDAARVAALTLLAAATIGALGGIPADLRLGMLQASFFLVPLAYARAAGLRPLGDAGFGRPRLRDLALTAVASMASLWILKGLADVQLEIFRHFGREDVAVREQEQIVRTLGRAREAGGLAGLSLLAIVPPLCEEMLFRGLLLRGLARRFGAALGVGATAVFFAAMHGKETQIALMIFLGFYFGSLSALTGNLWPSILAHAINNGAVLVLQVGWGPQVQGFKPPWPLLALSLVVFGGALALLALDRRARRQDLEGGLRSPAA